MTQFIRGGNFAIAIKPGELKLIGNSYYVELQQGSEYNITLQNNGNTRCEAVVYIDDIVVGTWVLNACQTVIIERPAYIRRKFTFEAKHSNITCGTGVYTSDPNGLIRVIFKPEHVRTSPHTISETLSLAPSYSEVNNMSGNYSYQEYGSTPGIPGKFVNYNFAREVVVRLIAKADNQSFQLLQLS